MAIFLSVCKPAWKLEVFFLRLGPSPRCHLCLWEPQISRLLTQAFWGGSGVQLLIPPTKPSVHTRNSNTSTLGESESHLHSTLYSAAQPRLLQSTSVFLLFPYSAYLFSNSGASSRETSVFPPSFSAFLKTNIYRAPLMGKDLSCMYFLTHPSAGASGQMHTRAVQVLGWETWTVGGDGLWLTCQAACWLTLADAPLFKENPEYVTSHMILSSFLYVPHFSIRLGSAPRQRICPVPLSIFKTCHGAWYAVWSIRQSDNASNTLAP